ncbi:hypothetical protein D3C87_1860650 [compost metagenome]
MKAMGPVTAVVVAIIPTAAKMTLIRVLVSFTPRAAAVSSPSLSASSSRRWNSRSPPNTTSASRSGGASPSCAPLTLPVSHRMASCRFQAGALERT